jgi:hypothetical protein
MFINITFIDIQLNLYIAFSVLSSTKHVGWTCFLDKSNYYITFLSSVGGIILNF